MLTLGFCLVSFLCVFGHPPDSCDESADILFVQDLQASISYDLKKIQRDIDDTMEEFQEIFRRPRFGLVTFKEIDHFGCVDVVRSLTRDDDELEDAYERLKANEVSSSRHQGSALAGLLAGLAWDDIEWQSQNRIIVLITNNLPISYDDTDAAPFSHHESAQCSFVVHPPQELVLDYAKLSGATVLFVIPNAPNVVDHYWKEFNFFLGQSSALVRNRSDDLDDWIEDLQAFFRNLIYKGCDPDRTSPAAGHSTPRATSATRTFPGEHTPPRWSATPPEGHSSLRHSSTTRSDGEITSPTDLRDTTSSSAYVQLPASTYRAY
eukprot:Gregarina_sp_Poly_1__5041@NODE_266_length_10382_cov_507_901212_g232_i0_p6_GENE_NODE_266_length_10382_cov_507_901212_g232_i0NODE_266_length_10382_cov_507_901212_g232_i0_p6_ORF_typecomplete_len321_score35_86Integrin_beta/PF00362_18/4_7e07VWA_2/PF13519_6/0_00053VWA/PF00092_28/0_00068Herpes_BLLF1/PF05109_13/0_0021TfoX_C/PF04994_13/1_4TfoX_C/PF04994_13/6_2_NODE_266_length_10382_cov_507_901212_g232_i049465908